ncbi:hypothetical protein ACKFKG_17880 [Phormidesmis sp. 146-35]
MAQSGFLQVSQLHFMKALYCLEESTEESIADLTGLERGFRGGTKRPAFEEGLSLNAGRVKDNSQMKDAKSLRPQND